MKRRSQLSCLSRFLRSRTALCLFAAAFLLGCCASFASGVYTGVYMTFPFEVLLRIRHTFTAPPPPDSDFFLETKSRIESDCPPHAFVIVAIGQSNAANYVSPIAKRIAEIPAFNFLDGRCYRIEDPLLGATGGRLGSLWTVFAQRL